MKVLLMVPPKYYHKIWDIRHFTYPIGIWNIASVLEDRLGVQVKIVDCIAEGFENTEGVDEKIAKFGFSDELILKKVEEFSPDIIGLQCISSNQHNALIYYSKLLKKQFPEILILVGGAHITALPELVLKDADGSIDFAIIGEGETTVLELIENLRGIKKVKQLKGLGVWDEGDIVINLKRELIPDLDSLPLLNPTLFESIDYPQTPPHSYFTFGRKWTEVMFSRGCIFNCDWCFSPEMWHRKLRKMSLPKVRKQLELLWDYGYRELLLEDDNLFLDKSWGKDIIKLIKEIGFYWQVAGGLHLEQLDMESVDEIAESNCTTVYLPINVIREIGEQNVDILLNRKYMDIFKRFKENHIYVFSSIILGIPDQSFKNMELQVNYARNLVSKGWVDYSVIFAFSPLPGTSWWYKIVNGNKYRFANKVIKWEQFSNHVPCEVLTPYWDFKEVEEFILKAHEYINGQEKTQRWFNTKQWVRL